MSESETTGRRSEKEIFVGALDQATAAERQAYLDGACGTDAKLRQRIENLLEQHFKQDSFMKAPAVDPGTTLKMPEPQSPGAAIGRYRLLEKLGEGGFGTVYVAEQKEPVRRRVALKIIKLGMDTRQVIARFEAERQALAMMDHPNIARVLDAGTTEQGRPYFVMELVRGVSLTEFSDGNRLSLTERLELFIAVCKAIQHAHQKGIIHRDLKPSNILVTLHDGVPVPKVIDFGIAKAMHGDLTDKTLYTQFQQFIGTPAYISPEQAEMSGLDLDTRSDIYSLGVLLYELLTSKTPLDGDLLMRSGLEQFRRIIREEDPPRPSTRLSTLARIDADTVAKHRAVTPEKLNTLIRGDLDWIVMKCLEKDRARRYETASDLAADLHRFLHDEPVNARPPSRAYRLQKFVRRHRPTVFAATAIAFALVLGLALSTVAFIRERQARLATQAAENARQAETVRADAVRDFMGQLLTTIAPELLQQGHQRPVRDLLLSADRLASTALSNAPAAELELRGLISTLYFGEGPSLLDPAASYAQLQRMSEILPRVPEDRLVMPRDALRISTAAAGLWAGHTNSALEQLHALQVEFRTRTPPAPDFQAWSLAVEGNWQFWRADSAAAEARLRESAQLLSPASPRSLVYYTRAYLALAIADRGAPAEAEQIIREVLLPPETVPPEIGMAHVGIVSALAGVLCRQLRFDEAGEMLAEQHRVLASRNFSPREQIALQKKLGEVHARAGKPAEALPILLSVATNALGTPRDCVEAAAVALGSGDLKRYRELCGLGLLQFTGGAEGFNAISLSEMFLAASQDELVLRVVSEMLRRTEAKDDLSRAANLGIRAWYEYRTGNPAEALELLARCDTLPPPTEPILARVTGSPDYESTLLLRQALALGRLGRFPEATQAFTKGVRLLGTAPSAEAPRDLGDTYGAWYIAQAHRQEAESMFEAHEIPIPPFPNP